MIIPSFPNKDDLFLMVSIDGTCGASGWEVNNVNLFTCLIEGGAGGIINPSRPSRDDLFFIVSIEGT